MLLKFIIFILIFLNKYTESKNDISVNGTLNVSNLKISSKDNRDNGIIFKNQETEYKLGLTTQNECNSCASAHNKPPTAL